MSEPILNQDDLRSPCWRKLKAHIESELVGLRVNLEADITHDRAVKLRGQIRTHVLLLALENAPTLAIVEEEPD